MQPIMELAEKEKLTFYDASFLYCCLRFGNWRPRLVRAARKNTINVIETEELIHQLG
jgi:predicted nucleic acid-binding protein